MAVLRAVRALALPDWAIGAGFVRAAVWDHMAARTRPSPLADIDVLYHQARRLDPRIDRRLERRLGRDLPGLPWSVTNQARMHHPNRERPYRRTETAIAHWIEVPTCIAVRLEADETLKLIAPLGTDDLLAGVIRPTPSARRKMDVYHRRLASKQWRRRWPMLIERRT